MTTAVKEFLENNVDLIDSTSIYTVIAQNFEGSGRDILEVLNILKEADISIDYTNSTIDDIYQVLKLVFENIASINPWALLVGGLGLIILILASYNRAKYNKKSADVASADNFHYKYSPC